MSKAIKVDNLSKAYQLGQIGTGTLSRDLERTWARFRGKDDPFLKIGEVNDRTTKSISNVVWSLKDINFEVEHGDSIGIIGRNGAGKSTLLKILSRITSPTTGSVKIKGRIASLLEVGTGFHPELSGRENIFLNGAILGMRKAEIKRKFDEIVDFSGVERYIDTPVKRYSSGMYVRLAFAVAAHLESEILIVDEVLAVGDAEFQKKCMGKIGTLSKGEGRTVLFVSHNMATIKEVCNKGILLENGKIASQGNINDTVNNYIFNNLNSINTNAKVIFEQNPCVASHISLEWAELFNQENSITDTFLNEDTLYIKLKLTLMQDLDILRFVFKAVNSLDNSILGFGQFFKDLKAGSYTLDCGPISLKDFNSQMLILKLTIDSPGNLVLLGFINLFNFSIQNQRPAYQYLGEAHNEILIPDVNYSLQLL